MRRESTNTGEQRWLMSGAVARRLGIQTSTLNKWRRHGRGPDGWKRISATVVVYPIENVYMFERTWRTGAMDADR